MNYYNEFDVKTAAWLKALIDRGLIPYGDVDTRSITQVSPDDLKGYTQCHFFAGIGGWAEALALAGWPSDKPVWTGSCPCQPWSDAGEGKGELDERHLWPVFFRLIQKCRPPVVFGEQVASKIALRWLDGVYADLESADYAVGSADLCAAGVGAPHIRQRIYWLGHSTLTGLEGYAGHEAGRGEPGRIKPEAAGSAPEAGRDRGLADAELPKRRQEYVGEQDERDWRDAGREEAHRQSGTRLEIRGHWDDFDLIPCADGKSRRIEPGLAPLAHGVPARVVRLRGYGNAIVPPLAAQFVQAYLET